MLRFRLVLIFKILESKYMIIKTLLGNRILIEGYVMFSITKRTALISCFLISTACTVHTDKVILNSNQAVGTLPTNSLTKTDNTTFKTTTGIESSYVLNFGDLNTQQQIEIYQWLQKYESPLSVVRESNLLRVRFKQPVSQDEFTQMIRMAGKLDETTYKMRFDGSRASVKKED